MAARTPAVHLARSEPAGTDRTCSSERSLSPASSVPDAPGSTELKPCHPLGMSGDENELLGSAFSSTERVIARRFLLGTPTFSLALILLTLGNMVSEVRPLGLSLPIFAVALIILSVILQRSRPQGSERLSPRNLRRIARVADVPELGAMIMVYGGLIAALTFTSVALIVYMASTPT